MANVNLIVGNDGSNTLQGTAGADLIYGFRPERAAGSGQPIIATRVASGLSSARCSPSAPPGDAGRLFLVEKTGQIKILDLNDRSGSGNALPRSCPARSSTAGERGLLGLAFDPTRQQRLFLRRSDQSSGDTEIRRYHVSAIPNVADPRASRRSSPSTRPTATNHKAGWLGFGPDGYLYIATGDGGSTPNAAQDVNSLLGKILRIDVHADAFPGDPRAIMPSLPTTPSWARREPTKSLRLDCAIRGGPASIAGWATSTSPMSATRQCEEIDHRPEGCELRLARVRGPGVFQGGPARRWNAARRSTLMITAWGSRSPAVMSIAAKRKRCRGNISSPTSRRASVFTLRFNGTAWVATDRTSQIMTDVGS